MTGGDEEPLLAAGQRSGAHGIVGGLGARLDALAARLPFRLRSMLVPDRLTMTVDGVETRFHVGNAWEHERFTEYRHPPDGTVLSDFVRRIRPSDVVWDVGSNVGIYSCFAANVVEGSADAVHAFEPLPKNVDRIETNLALNGRSGTVHRLALGDSIGRVTLSLNSPDAAGAFGSMRRANGPASVEAPQTTGVEVVESRGVPPPTVLKVDVQGAEAGVLRGLGELVAPDRCRLVYCNVYEKHFESPADEGVVRDRLRRRGYDVARIATWSGGHFLRATAGG